MGLTADYSILDPDDAGGVLKRAVKAVGVAATHTPIDRIAGVISRAKNDLLTPATFEPRWGRPVDDLALRVWPIYQQMLLRADSVDFDDMKTAGAKLVWSPKSNVVLYGTTTNIPLARSKGVPVALAPDWSLSGSVNILDELRFAAAWDKTKWGSTFTSNAGPSEASRPASPSGLPKRNVPPGTGTIVKLALSSPICIGSSTV